jgi:hypothetical protein
VKNVSYEDEIYMLTLVLQELRHGVDLELVSARFIDRNCSGSRPKVGGYLRGVGGLAESGSWARITRC